MLHCKRSGSSEAARAAMDGGGEVNVARINLRRAVGRAGLRHGAASLGWTLALGGLLASAACTPSSDQAGTCQTGADCPSGACEAGLCVDDGTGGAGGGDAGPGGGGDSATGGGGANGTSSSGSAGGGTGGGGLCQPEGDGEIRRDEVPLQAGYRATYLTAMNATFSTAGSMEDGEKVWDFEVDLTGDHLVLSETLEVGDLWFAPSFPTASYAARLGESVDLLGVFQTTDDALLLIGVVSPEGGTFRTELAYDPPVEVLQFPLAEGNAWSTTSTITGVLSGAATFYTETYDNAVDARGTAKTPYSDFDVLRIRVDLTRTVAGFPTTQRTFAFTTECFGTVARIVSQQNETAPEFESTSEVFRLSP